MSESATLCITTHLNHYSTALKATKTDAKSATIVHNQYKLTVLAAFWLF